VGRQWGSAGRLTAARRAVGWGLPRPKRGVVRGTPPGTMRGQEAAMDESDRLLDAAKSTATGTADGRDRALLEEAHPADVASVFRQLALADQVKVFRTLSRERAGE